MTAYGRFGQVYRLLAWLGLMAWWAAVALVAYSLITHQIGVLAHAIFLGLFFGFGVVSMASFTLLFQQSKPTKPKPNKPKSIMLSYVGFLVVLMAVLVGVLAVSALHHRLFIEGLPLFD